MEYLESIGFLGKNVGIPHCYIVKGTRWVEDGGDDLSILSNTGTTAIFCPVIIGRSGHYQDSFAKYRARNINVAVGTDTFPPDFSRISALLPGSHRWRRTRWKALPWLMCTGQ